MTYEFSVISPMYNVERYLPDFLASLERQTYDFDRIQVILVDDGSSDDTLPLARTFAEGRENVTVLTKENGGQASARNLGLSAAEGEWLTFPDPDDALSDDYFERVAEAIARPDAADAALVSCRLLMWYEERDEVVDTHALAGRFRSGVRVADLDREPEWIQPHITSGFVRADSVRAAHITFPEELRLRFEDGNFVARYLLNCAAPVVIFVPRAEYRYRQRADNSSTIQSSFADPRKYTDTIRYGFRGVIAEAGRLGRTLPRWAQNLFLYDQFWILRSSQTAAVRQATYPVSMYAELDELIPEYLHHVDAEAIRDFNLMPVAPWMRDALELVKAGGGHSEVYRPTVDARRGLQALVYRFAGEQPTERLIVDGNEIEPRYDKTQELEYVGRPIAWQRTLWVPEEVHLRLQLGGREIDQFHAQPSTPAPAYASSLLAEGTGRALRHRLAKAIRRRVTGQLLPLLRRDVAAHSPTLARRFAHAWVFIDRDVDANDSAEDLYWWVARHHPEVNAWFVVRRGTPDWGRLAARGARLVAYGSPEFFALLINADHLASSHADRFVTDSLPRKWRPARYAFTFLQHGVIKGDLSLWLNGKQIDVFVTSTQDEHDYISGVSPYRFGSKEVRLTGLPRFDVLLQRAAENTGDGESVVIMPTWRNYLVSEMGSGSSDRQTTEQLHETNYGRALSELLHNGGLLALKQQGARLIFMPHPNMQPYLGEFDLPPDIEVLSYADRDVREVIVAARVLVTDYSSVAFNAAYLRRPVVYFQFDQPEYAAGHTEREGYFSYESHGFGPVIASAQQVVEEIRRAWAGGPAAEYLARMDAAFPVRDGNNRQRVFDAMVEARTHRPIEQRSQAAPPDRWAGFGSPHPTDGSAPRSHG